jgi:transcription-repair coupling factor (superfamily II helicase)
LLHDCQIETDLELCFPDDYVNNTAERISLYRRLDALTDEKGLKLLEEEIADRFGPLPSIATEMTDVVRLRWCAQQLGFEKLILKNSKMIGFFISDQDSPFYRSETFTQILSFLKNNPKSCKITEKNQRLSLNFESVNTINQALKRLNRIVE